MPDENGFNWGDFFKATAKVLAAVSSGIVILLGLEKATNDVETVNEQRQKNNQQPITGAQELTYYTAQVNNSCQKFGKVMSGASMIIDALSSIINPNQYQPNPMMNNPMGYPYGYNGYGNYYNNYSGMYSGPVVNPLNAMVSGYNTQQQPPLGGFNNNPFDGGVPNGITNVGNNTHVQWNPDGSHRIYMPGGGYAYCTGWPWAA